MDLIGVNNSVVNMRKTVIKAKIHVIRQLLKQAKTFSSKKVANEEQKAKNQRKAERLRAEVHIIKHLKKDDVSRSALLNTQSFLPEINPEKDADRMDELLKKRAFVRLANCPVIKKEVEAFRKKYPSWSKDLAKVFKVLGKKQAKKEEKLKKKKRDEEKQKKKEAKMALKKSELGNESSAKSETEKDSAGSEGENDENLEESDDDNDVSDENIEQSEAENSDGENSLDGENNSDESEDENLEAESLEKPEKIAKIPKSRGEMEIKQLDLNELIAENSDDESDDDSLSDESKELKEANDRSIVPKDSFFIGGASDDVSDNEDEDIKESDFTTDVAVTKKRNDFIGKGSRFQNSRGRGSNERGRGFNDRGRGFSDRGRGLNSRGSGFSDRGRGFSDRGRGFSDRSRGFSDRGRGFNDRGHGFNDRGHGNFHKTEEKLHPSWAAKKNQKPMIISGFQSKKIKFDEEKPHEKFGEKPDQSSNLHPSWAAKKSTNKGIAQFEGKKVVFNDD